jgi:prepilin-type N-terminal cleavage/methylation domain-containing protein
MLLLDESLNRKRILYFCCRLILYRLRTRRIFKQNCKSIKMQKKGFTLIELLVIILIIGLLASILIVSMTGAVNNANDARRKADLNQLVKAISMIKVSNDFSNQEECNLGSNCTEIEQKLAAQGILIPKDPNGNFYKYTATDNEFVLKTTLSNSHVYYYDSKENKYVDTSVISGQCGTANKSYNYADSGFGTDTFCSSGSSNPSSIGFPSEGSSVSWTCSGSNGGSNSGTCTASRSSTPVNGVCGSAVRTFAYNETSYGSYVQCTSGTSTNATFPNQGSSVSWTCSGSNGGSNSGTCTASRDVLPISQYCGTTISYNSSATVNGNTVWCDSYGGMWTSKAGSTMNWTTANNYCNSLTYAGTTGWALPTITHAVNCINSSSCKSSTGSLSYIWTSSVSGSVGQIVSSEDGATYPQNIANPTGVRCRLGN